MKKNRILFLSMLCLLLTASPLPATAQKPDTQDTTQQEEKNIVLAGIVTDAETSETLIGANIYYDKGKNKGCVTNASGRFRLAIPKEASAIFVSYIGYEMQRIELRKIKNRNDIRIRLIPRTQITEEIVVTGIQKRSTESFTGEYVRVSGDDLIKRNPNNLLAALQQFDPSFRIVEDQAQGSNPNSIPEFRIRGDVQLGGNATNTDYDAQQMQMFYQRLCQHPQHAPVCARRLPSVHRNDYLEPERINEVIILKDAAATAIYGSKASNGVVVFETKKPLAGRLRFSYSGNIGITYPDLTDFNLMNAQEKLEAEWKAGFFNLGNAEQMNTYNRYRRNILNGVDTYWISQPLRTAITQRHTLSAEGGDDAFRYRLSASDIYMPRVMKGSERG